MNTELTPTFDYTQVDSNKQARLQALAQQGRLHLRRTKEEIIAFGEVLLEAKTLLPHGQFRSWAAAEFGIPDSTITYAMCKARGGDIEIENVNINILPERAESKRSREEELEPMARIFILDILSKGQILSDTKVFFMREGLLPQWPSWCAHVEMSPNIADLFIGVFTVFMTYPKKTPQQLLPLLVTPLEILVGYLLSKYTKGVKEDVEAICCYADWIHGMALLQEGRVTDIPLDQQQEMLKEAEEGLQKAWLQWLDEQRRTAPLAREPFAVLKV